MNNNTIKILIGALVGGMSGLFVAELYLHRQKRFEDVEENTLIEEAIFENVEGNLLEDPNKVYNDYGNYYTNDTLVRRIAKNEEEKPPLLPTTEQTKEDKSARRIEIVDLKSFDDCDYPSETLNLYYGNVVTDGKTDTEIYKPSSLIGNLAMDRSLASDDVVYVINNQKKTKYEVIRMEEDYTPINNVED